MKEKLTLLSFHYRGRTVTFLVPGEVGTDGRTRVSARVYNDCLAAVGVIDGTTYSEG